MIQKLRPILLRARGPLLVVTAITVFLLGLGYRVGLLLREPVVRGDAWSRYVPMANNLVAGHGFSTDREPPYRPTTHEVPGYPLFLASILFVSGGSLRAIVGVQLCLEIVTLTLTVLIARAIFGKALIPSLAVALLGWGCVFLPSSAADFMAVDLALPLQTGLLYAFTRISLAQTDSLGAWAVTGALAGLSSLVRVDTYLVFVAALSVVVAQLMISRSFRRHIPCLVACWCAFLLALSPWVLRDGIVTGRWQLPGIGQFTYSHVGSGLKNWMDTWADEGTYLELYVWGPFERRPSSFGLDLVPDASERTAAEDLFARAKRAQIDPFPEDIDTGFETLSHEARRTRPIGSTVAVGLRRMLTTWIRVPRTTIAPDEHRRSVMSAVYGFWLALLILAIPGAWTLWRESHLGTGLLIAIVLARSAIPYASAWGLAGYYLYPAVPAVVIFAAAGLSAVLGIQRSTKSQTPAGSTP